MLTPVLKDVDQRIADFAWRPQGARMVSVGPHLAAPSEHAVDGPCQANGESLETADQRRVPVRFDQQVDVIVLNAELEDPEACP